MDRILRLGKWKSRMGSVNKNMTKEQAIERLKEINEDPMGDVERNHMQADDVLCELLDELGYEDVVAEWKKIYKYFA